MGAMKSKFRLVFLDMKGGKGMREGYMQVYPKVSEVLLKITSMQKHQLPFLVQIRLLECTLLNLSLPLITAETPDKMSHY